MSLQGSESTGGPEVPTQTSPNKSLLARVVAIVVAPRSVFEQFTEKPAWIGATILLSVFSLIFAFIIFEPIILPAALDQIERSSASEDALAQQEEFMLSPAFKIVVMVMGPIANFAFVIITGLLMHLVAGMMLGGKSTPRGAMSVSAHGFLIMIPRSLILLPIMWSRQDPDVSLGPGVLFPVSEAVGFGAKFIANFLGGFDLFNIWVLALCILGMSVISHLPTKQVGVVFSIGYLFIIIWSLIGSLSG